jgi:hypothetical protein
MAATPPPERPGYMPNMPMSVARLPIPGNAEFLLYVVALIVAGIVTASSSRVTPNDWFIFFQWTTVGYLLSRGIAKASRVLEQ